MTRALPYLNLALGIVLMVWTVAAVGLLITGNGLVPGGDYSLGCLMAWAILNHSREARR